MSSCGKPSAGPMAFDADTLIIGAGVIGLAVARELALEGQSVIVLDKAEGPGRETSSRNSEVIHAGIYYPKGSLKARMCVEGKHLLYDYCAGHGVEAKRLGKLIVATSPEEEEKLAAIAALAAANGVGDLAWLTSSEAAALEPDVRCTRALFSPSTGIIDSSAYMLALQGEAESKGTTFAFHSACTAIRQQQAGFTITARSGDGTAVDITARHIVNAAGHGAHDVARSIAGFPGRVLPPQYFAKGSYCSVSGPSPFRHLVYPVPVPGALGIHATLDISGAVRFGPDISWAGTLDYTLPGGLPATFSAAIGRYWPGVAARELEPSYCGVRPKIHGPETGFADFMIQDASVHGMAGLVSLFGIESPGLTASLSIARHVRDLLRGPGESK